MKRILSMIAGVSALAAIGAVMLQPGAAGAQSAPRIMVNWQAGTYVPPDYDGKALPTADSPVVVGVDLADQGRHIDLSSQKVYWYLNDDFYQGGTGLTRITFTAPHYIGATTVQVKVSLPDYAGGIARTISVPVVPPQVVVRTSSPSLAASAAPFTLQAFPYFFNIADPSSLQYAWSLRGAYASGENPFLVTKDMAQAGNDALLELQVANPGRVIERATKRLTIFSSY